MDGRTAQRLVMLAAVVWGCGTPFGFAEEVRYLLAENSGTRVSTRDAAQAGCPACACCCSTCGCGGEEEGPWSIQFTQTAEYVTNLALPFTLTPDFASVLQDDFQFQTLAGVKYTERIDDDQAVAFSYVFHQTLHPVVDELDLMQHAVIAEYSRRLNDDNIVSFNYNYSYYFLQGQSYVSQNNFGIALLHSLNPCCDVKVGVDYLKADFRIDPLIDSDNVVPRLELIRYLNAKRTDYISLGTGYIRSNALLDGYSYDAASVFLSGRWRLGPCDRQELQLLGQYSYYGFLGPDPVQVGVFREDHIIQLSARLTHYFSDNASIFAHYSYFNDDSNVVRQNFDSHGTGIAVSFNW